MKNKRPSLRLGSFELLESRALLAHAGMPHGMFHESIEQRRFADFERPPAMESRGFDASAGRHGGDIGGLDRGPRNQRTFEAPPSTSSNYDYPSPASAAPSVYTQPVTVIVIITVSPVTIQSAHYSEPPHSSAYDALDRQTQNASFSNPPPSNLLSSPPPSRTSSNFSKSLDSLSVLSSLSLKPSVYESATDESEEATATTDTRDDQATRDDQETLPRAATTDAAQQSLPSTPDTDEADLIELDPEELLKRAKRKMTRAATSPQFESKLRETNALREYASSRVPDRHSEIWLAPAEVDAVLTPVNDDLIELLAADQPEATKPTAARSQPFVSAGPAITLEANLGYYQAVETSEAETIPAAIPATAQPAAVATALPARATE